MDSEVAEASGGTRGHRLWLATLLVGILALVLQGYGINSWPMADDEVPSLVEMGLLNVDAQAFSVPANQIGRLPRAVPVFYRFQRFAIDHLPKSEVSYRLPSLVFGVLTSILAFFVAARWRGLWFGAALAIVMNGSQLFVYLAQLDRFYALPVLLMTATLILMWLPAGVWGYVAIAVLTALSVLSHNVTLVIFGLAFGASVLLYLLRRVPLELPMKSGLALGVAGLIYVFYLLPIVRGWNSTGNPTPVLVSFVAQLGVPILALAVLGGWFALTRRDSAPVLWALLIFAAGICTLQLPTIQWNPRYFIFFFPVAWVLSAYAMEHIARRIGLSLNGAAWYASVVVLLAPSMLSHYIDGTRHNYRAAAEILVDEDRARDPILSDDAETISYYLPDTLRHNLFVRTKVTQLPISTFYLVARMNAWAPLPVIPGRHMQLLGEIYHRRFDQFSHILRVYRVSGTE
ncbi:MAG TPA: hypothetical protein VLV86_10115 [Vicinamibacterales bacterium]|nr:hypothetical protein [Vicinamibacterales bacterium]